MLEKASVAVLAAIALAIGSPLAAQNDSFAERERALQRDYAAQQRQYAERQREFAAQQREQQQESSGHMRELARELSRAKSQLAVSAAEIARLSAQLSRPVVQKAQNGFQPLGQRVVLGIVIEDDESGVRVTGVSPNGPAAAVGLQVGDTIAAIDGLELRRSAGNGAGPPTAAFLGRLGDLEPGQDVELRTLRDGSARTVVVKAGENSALPFKFEPGRYVSMVGDAGNVLRLFRGRWNDAELVSLTPALGEYFGVDEGLLVVRSGSMGDLGLRDGDVILEIGGRQPQTPEHAMRILASFEPGESLQTSIMRQRRRETLTMTVPAAGQGNGVF
jgi:type II secretory pathway component PulC